MLSHKWSLHIVRAISDNGTLRYCNLQEVLPDINSRMLSERLSELEEEGIIERNVKKTKPICIEYRVTEKGKDLRKVFDAFCQWSKKWG
jgi:DNA-binding HxlR family transcriptional regulator